jgi:putative oxidoreductase
MARFSLNDVALLVSRLGLAALLVGFHGWPRLVKAFLFAVQGQPWPFVAVVERLGFPLPALFAVLSALSESLAAAFVAAGFFTRSAAAIIAFNMAVALWNEAAKGDPIELPALYLLGAIVIALLGPGRWSLDGLRRRL